MTAQTTTHLRPYQLRDSNSIIRQLQTHNSVLYQLPTGGGKFIFQKPVNLSNSFRDIYGRASYLQLESPKIKSINSAKFYDAQDRVLGSSSFIKKEKLIEIIKEGNWSN